MSHHFQQTQHHHHNHHTGKVTNHHLVGKRRELSLAEALINSRRAFQAFEHLVEVEHERHCTMDGVICFAEHVARTTPSPPPALSTTQTHIPTTSFNSRSATGSKPLLIMNQHGLVSSSSSSNVVVDHQSTLYVAAVHPSIDHNDISSQVLPTLDVANGEASLPSDVAHHDDTNTISNGSFHVVDSASVSQSGWSTPRSSAPSTLGFVEEPSCHSPAAAIPSLSTEPSHEELVSSFFQLHASSDSHLGADSDQDEFPNHEFW